MGLFRKYPKAEPPAKTDMLLAAEALDRASDANRRGDTAASEREVRLAQQHYDRAYGR